MNKMIDGEKLRESIYKTITKIEMDARKELDVSAAIVFTATADLFRLMIANEIKQAMMDNTKCTCAKCGKEFRGTIPSYCPDCGTRLKNE